jgi:hypothetical protein
VVHQAVVVEDDDEPSAHQATVKKRSVRLNMRRLQALAHYLTVQEPILSKHLQHILALLRERCPKVQEEKELMPGLLPAPLFPSFCSSDHSSR